MRSVSLRCVDDEARGSAEQTSEGASEVGVEDGVDDGIESAIGVAEPDEGRHHARVHSTGAPTVLGAGRVARFHVMNADRIDDVYRKERSPAQQEHGYNIYVPARIYKTRKYFT